MSYTPPTPNGQATMANSAAITVASNQSSVPVTNDVDTSSIYNGTTVLTPQYALINITSTSGVITLVSGVTSKKIVVLSYVLVSSVAVQLVFTTGSSTAISGILASAANAGVIGTYVPTGHFQTAAGDLLGLDVVSTASVGGHLTYITV